MCYQWISCFGCLTWHLVCEVRTQFLAYNWKEKVSCECAKYFFLKREVLLIRGRKGILWLMSDAFLGLLVWWGTVSPFSLMLPLWQNDSPQCILSLGKSSAWETGKRVCIVGLQSVKGSFIFKEKVTCSFCLFSPSCWVSSMGDTRGEGLFFPQGVPCLFALHSELSFDGRERLKWVIPFFGGERINRTHFCSWHRDQAG